MICGTHSQKPGELKIIFGTGELIYITRKIRRSGIGMTTDALIIRENNNIGEADRFVTALTRELGVIRASARGAQNPKSRNSSATQLLSYSRLTLRRGRDKYIVEDARPISVFFALRSDIVKLALAQYFCELAGVIAPQDEPAEDFLRLMLNALHFLAEGSRDPRQIKGVLELRMLGLAGFMPDLTMCRDCGAFESEVMWLSPTEGSLVCGRCSHRPTNGYALMPNVLAAMRHVTYSEFEKCFSFTMSDEGITAFSNYTEAFLLAQLGRGFKTLDFYHTLKS
jgi:DNA repair protein RecO (recombination protein O)